MYIHIYTYIYIYVYIYIHVCVSHCILYHTVNIIAITIIILIIRHYHYYYILFSYEWQHIYIYIYMSLWLKMLYSSSPISQHFHIQIKRIHGPLGPGLGRRMGLGVHAHVLRRFVDAQTPPPLQPGKGQAADEARPKDDLGFASVRSI